MSFRILYIPPFERQLKRLAKKYPSLKVDFSEFLTGLVKNPHQGKALGRNCYKIRFAIKSKGKGKSGGARIITNIAISEDNVYLLAIYDKSDKTTLTDKELSELLEYLAD
jgi:mRNA-degrading endonuclease RelE of RelBE toxin-antitoxin system